MLKILPARLQQYVNKELSDVQTGFRKGRGTRAQITNICWILEKARNSRKTSASVTMPLTVWITTNCGNSSRDGNTCLLRNLYAGQEATFRTRHGIGTGSKLRMEYLKAIYCHLAYVTYMKSTSCKMPGWMKHKLESRLLGEI